MRGATYRAFVESRTAAIPANDHVCIACPAVAHLDLKVVLHRGPAVRQSVRSGSDLLGPAVTVAHRLLKNTVRDRIGNRPYLFVTDAARQRRVRVRRSGRHHLRRPLRPGEESDRGPRGRAPAAVFHQVRQLDPSWPVSATFEPDVGGTRVTQTFETVGLISAISSWVFSRGSYEGSFRGELEKFARIAEREGPGSRGADTVR